MFQNEDLKADKYVNTLVNDYQFYTSKYIRSFHKNIDLEQSKEDSVCEFLRKIYAQLSDNVHGRYKNLTKIKGLEIKYDKELLKRYERLLTDTLSILAVLYILRFNDETNEEIVELSKISKVVML
jgi:hypothetical protein